MTRRHGSVCSVLGASALLFGAGAMPWAVRSAAAETEFSAHNPITRVAAMPSLVAAGQMGAQGFSRDPLVAMDLTTLLADCQRLSSPTTQWFSQCDPAGMAASLSTNYPAQSWDERTFSGTGVRTKLEAINFIGKVLSSALETPVAVPFFGRGDHWATVAKVRVELDATRTVTDVNWLYFHDAVPIVDGAMNRAYNSDWVTGDDFGTSKYFRVLDVVGPTCPPCTAPDPYLNKYVLLFEPPPGMFLHSDSAPLSPIRFARAKGLLGKGEALTEERASRDVQRALALTTLPGEPAVRDLLRAGTPGRAFSVTGRLPEGGMRRYVVVPILDAVAQSALLFVELDAADGSVLNVTLPSEHFVFRPITAQQAAQRALSHLRPLERLGAPTLRWDAAELHQAARKPFQAFYELPVLSGDAPVTEVVRLSYNGGIWIGRVARTEEIR